MVVTVSGNSSLKRKAGSEPLPDGRPLKKTHREKAAIDRSVRALAHAAMSPYELLLSHHRVGSPLVGLDGEPSEGIFKSAYVVEGHPNQVAVCSSPHRRPHPEIYAESIEREFRTLQALQGARHIPRQFACFGEPGRRYTSIQENGGSTVYDTYLNENNPVRQPITLSVIERIAKLNLEAVADLHARGLIHGDIKPENCTERLLLDFGLTKQIGNQFSSYPFFTPNYRPPETTLWLQTGLSGDIWAFGCLLFELATNELLVPIQHALDDPVQHGINSLHAILQRLDMQLPLNGPFKLDLLDEQNRIKPSTLPPFNPYKTVLSAVFNQIPPQNERARKRYKQLIDLIDKMLQFNFKDRITAADALKHPFFTDPDHTDLSLQLKIEGERRPICLRIRDANQKVLETLDLSECSQTSCCHIQKSATPYRFEYFHKNNPNQIITCSEEMLTEGKLFILNLGDILAEVSASSSSSQRASSSSSTDPSPPAVSMALEPDSTARQIPPNPL